MYTYMPIYIMYIVWVVLHHILCVSNDKHLCLETFYCRSAFLFYSRVKEID